MKSPLAYLRAWRVRFSAWLDSISDQNDVLLGPGLWLGFGEERSGFIFVPCAHLEEREALRTKVAGLEKDLLTLKLEGRELLLLLIQALQDPETPEQGTRDAQRVSEQLLRIQPLLSLPEDEAPPA